MYIKKFLLVFLILINLSLEAETSHGFKRLEIDTADAINDVFFRDINNDGLKDLFMTTGEPSKKERRKLSIYLQNKAGFSEKADTLINFPKDAVVYDVGDLPEKSDGPAIIFLGAGGLSYYPCHQGTYQQIPQYLSDISSVYVVPSPNGPVRARLFHQIDGLGVVFICIPGHTGLHIFNPLKQDGFNNPFTIPLSVMASFELGDESDGDNSDPVALSRRLVIQVPELFFKCFDQDNTEDLIAVTNDHIVIYKGLSSGLFQAEPIYQTTLNLSSGKSSGLLEPNYVVHVADANGDRQQDIMVTNASMSTKKTSTKVYLFVNRNGTLPYSPNQVILFSGTMGNNIKFQDINGDGCVDLVIPSANISLFQFVKILLSQKLDYTKNIHLWQKEGYSKNPDIKLKAQFRFNLENFNDLKGSFFYMGGDINGDGVKDLLKSDSESRKITIRLGQKGSDKLYQPHVFVELKEDNIPSEIEFSDINGDKRDDIIYRSGIGDSKKLVIWINGK